MDGREARAGAQDPLSLIGLPPVEDDYAPAPAVRWSQPLSRRAVAVLTAAAALAVGFLLTAGVTAGREEAAAQDARSQELITVIEERQQRVEELTVRLEELRGQVAAVEEEAASGMGGLNRTLADVEAHAGLRPLEGPGLRVVFDDAGQACRGSLPQDCRIQDVDLQLAVNSLFAAGAEGVTVDGQRVVPTTAIRGAGGSILVNYRVLAPPYEVLAVGDPDTLLARFSASDLAQDFTLWSEVYGLGFGVQAVEELRLEAYGGGVRLEHARAVSRGGSREEQAP